MATLKSEKSKIECDVQELKRQIQNMHKEKERVIRLHILSF